MALESKYVIGPNLIRVSYHCISCYFHINSCLKQLYISSKTEHFSYNGGCGIHVLRCLIGELAWAVNKRLQFISNKMLPKTVSYTSRELQ